MPSYTSFINEMNEIKNSTAARCINFDFTKNTNMADMIGKKLQLPLTNEDLPHTHKSATLYEFAIRGY